MSTICLVNGSCIDQEVDVIVNSANSSLWSGSGISGVIFKRAGKDKLTEACSVYSTPLNAGDAIITPAFDITNAKAIIHAVGPNFGRMPDAFDKLYNAYYNSLMIMMDNGFHSISFPLISSGIYAGPLKNAVAVSTKQCCQAYKTFIQNYADYDIDVKLCVFSASEIPMAQEEFNVNMA